MALGSRVPTPSAIRIRVEEAASRIRPFVRETPLEPSPYLSARTGADVWLKMENLQVTGSFKARGAFNALLCLSEAERARGIVTSSTGNHANACAHAMAVLGIDGDVWVPASTSRAKLDQLEARGATIELVDDDPGRVEVLARHEAVRSGRSFISPYNDLDVIAGQGTIALEVVAQLGQAPDAVLVPVGGGGLISGIGACLHGEDTRIVGCQPANSPVMALSVEAGRLLEPPYEASLSDATIGWAEPGAITFPISSRCVDDWILLSEEQIAGAIRTVIAHHSVLVEGAGALSLAALLAAPTDTYAGRRVVLVLSGSRISLRTLEKVLLEGGNT